MVSKEKGVTSKVGLSEADLCLLRDAMNKETLTEALEATEEVLQDIFPKLGYYRAVP